MRKERQVGNAAGDRIPKTLPLRGWDQSSGFPTAVRHM